ncbi:MAG: HTTM domain-containing protein [Pseudomonadota bacterium]
MLSLELALRLTEVLLALAFLQQSAEHMAQDPRDRPLYVIRFALSTLLLVGVETQWVLLALSLHSLAVLHRFAGPFNGGSDRMALLVLYCLTAATWAPPGLTQDLAFGYLAVQVILSYFISGKVKLENPEWRSGTALQDVFLFSAYPVSGDVRGLAHRPQTLRFVSWAVITLELAFPLALLNQTALLVALGATVVLHVANACLFGLNRFVWAWIAAYPSIIWLQDRLMNGV